jgi:hypothetical protein
VTGPGAGLPGGRADALPHQCLQSVPDLCVSFCVLCLCVVYTCCRQVCALHACYFILGMGLQAACNSIWQCMDYMKSAYAVSKWAETRTSTCMSHQSGVNHSHSVGFPMCDYG